MPSVLVPWSGAAGDHQTRNAEIFARAGAGLLIPQGELSPDRLADTVAEITAGGKKRDAMKSAALKLACPDAAERIADMVESVARR